MNELTPLDTLFELEHGSDLPLPPELRRLYGHLAFPLHPDRPYVIGNFVTTLDGVVSLGEPGNAGGGEISGFNPHDRMVMGLLRAIADVVIVGAGTLRASPEHRWTAQYISPSLSEPFQVLRNSPGKTKSPLNVIVTANGTVDLALPVFQSGEVAVLIVTTPFGARRIYEQGLPPSVQVSAVQSNGSISARDILEAVSQINSSDMVLVEGGPLLMGNFFAEHVLDELFLTLAPQVAGRDGSVERPGLVSGKRFAPDHPLWGTLIGVKRGGSHLFLRYTFDTVEHA
jgi:riboflavin biosynthesis pyrimidine reductase